MTQTALEIAAAVRAGEKTAEAVAKEGLARIALYDAVQPQAWIERFSDAAVVEQAASVDARRAAGERLPLGGVPVAIKDNIDALGLPTTAACPAFAYRPERSATVVERLQAAGAVIVGKTNLDQFATGLAGTRSPHGAPACVYNREYISGGSSSGSAVVVAAGLVPIALGTDTAGSGRVPAAFNGLVGLKPTKGRWSTRGVVPACRSLDCVSVLARTAADAALVDTVLAGFDAEDPYSRWASSQGRPIRGDGRLRAGVPRADQLELFGDAQSAALFADARRRIERLGASVVEVDIAPLLAAGRLLYAGPWVAERTAALEVVLKADPAAVHPAVRAVVEPGQGVSAVEAFRGQYALAGHVRATEALWDQVDLLMTPTAATIYRIAEVMAEPVALSANLGIYTNFANLLDLAAVSVPAGFRDNGTGFGVSFAAPAWSDLGLLDLAARWQTVSDLEPPALDLSGWPAQMA